MQAIEIKNLSFNYGNIKVFDNLNLSISKGSFVTIYGKNGSGKSVLAKIISGKYKSKSLIFGKGLTKKDIYFISDDLDYDGYVMNILINSLKGLDKKEISDRVLEVSKEFKFDKVLNRNFDDICLKDKKLVGLGLALLKEPKILVLDNYFEGIDKKTRIYILRKLKKLSITIINLTNDFNDMMVSDEIFIIGEGHVLLKGGKRKVLENEEFFEKYDLGLPFIINLSNKLRFYDLIDKEYFDEKKLVDDLWK